MCCYRQVQNNYACGHAVTFAPEHVACDNRFCKFSDKHPQHCSNCTKTCWQYRQYPQSYAPRINTRCPACEKAAARANGRK